MRSYHSSLKFFFVRPLNKFKLLMLFFTNIYYPSVPQFAQIFFLEPIVYIISAANIVTNDINQMTTMMTLLQFHDDPLDFINFSLRSTDS